MTTSLSFNLVFLVSVQQVEALPVLASRMLTDNLQSGIADLLDLGVAIV
jgi:hypothetical protein